MGRVENAAGTRGRDGAVERDFVFIAPAGLRVGLAGFGGLSLESATLDFRARAPQGEARV
jgi:hypothetical protein